MLTKDEWKTVQRAIEHKKTSAAVRGDREWLGHLAAINAKIILTKAVDQQPTLDDEDWTEVYYALDYLGNPDAVAIIEKIGPDGQNMYL